MIFSQKLQLIRKNKGLTQEELAGKLDVSTGRILGMGDMLTFIEKAEQQY